jgi:hypothetical protein
MPIQRPLVALACGATTLSLATAQGANFAAPVMIQAGDKVCGKGRMYPSPAAYDIDRDGKLDLVVGDLRGHLTYARQTGPGAFAAEQKLRDAAGKVLDFGNW